MPLTQPRLRVSFPCAKANVRNKRRVPVQGLPKVWLVGLDGVIFPSADTGSASNPMLGNLIIVAAQVVVATQMCVEEIFVGGRDVPPLLAVGLEGMFGMGVLSCVLIAMYYLPGVSGLSETPGR